MQPTGGININMLKLAVHVVFFLQTMCDHIKLQHTHCTQNKIIIMQWTKQLGCPFFTQLHQAFQ